MLNSTCQWPDCDRLAFARGLCGRCHMRARRAGIVESFTSPPAECRWCSTRYPEGTRSGKWFCSGFCQQADLKQRRAVARAKSLGERTCALCQSPVSLERRRDAQHCSITCQQAAWYLENEATLRLAARKWALDNPDSRSEHHSRRRAAKLAATVEPVDLAVVRARDRGICWICSIPVPTDLGYPHPLSRSLDHIIPLAKGGTHTMNNVALAHLRCNISKRDRLLEYLPQWLSRGEGQEVPGVDVAAA